MKVSPHWVGWIGYPILIVWCMGWAGAFVASLWFLITLATWAYQVLPL